MTGLMGGFFKIIALSSLQSLQFHISFPDMSVFVSLPCLSFICNDNKDILIAK